MLLTFATIAIRILQVIISIFTLAAVPQINIWFTVTLAVVVLAVTQVKIDRKSYQYVIHMICTFLCSVFAFSSSFIFFGRRQV